MRPRALMILSVMVASLACAEDDMCDEGMKKTDDGSCVADTGSGGSGGSSSGKAGAPATGEDFGASCTAHAECGGATTYCATPPGLPAYCTASGCDADPGVCPTDWVCFDVSLFVPGEPWICAPPF